MKFLVCKCDESTFELVIGTSPVVGDNNRFVVPMDVYYTENPIDLPEDVFNDCYDVLEELGIELLLVV